MQVLHQLLQQLPLLRHLPMEHSCIGPTENFTITVNPYSPVNDPASQTVVQRNQTRRR